MSEQSRIRQGVGALLLATALAPVASAQERTDGQDFNLPFQLNVVDTGPYDPDVATPVVVEGEASTDFVIPYASPARLLGPLLIQDFSEINDYQEVVILVDGEEVYRSSPGVVSPFMVPSQHDGWHWLYLTGAEGQLNTDVLNLSEGVHTLKCRFKGVRPMNSYMSCQFGFSGYPIRLYNFAGASITPYLTFVPPQSTAQFQAFSTLQGGTDVVTGDVFDWQVIAIEEESTDATIDQMGLLTLRASTSRLQVSVKFQLVPNFSKIKTAFLDIRVGFEVTTDDLGVIANPVPGQPGTFRLVAHPITPAGYIQWYGPDDQPFFRGPVVDVRPTAPGYYYAAQIDAAAYRFEAYPFGDYRPVFPTGSVYVEPPPAPPPSVPDEADAEKPVTKEALEKEGDCSVMTYNGENKIDRQDLSVNGRGLHFVLWRRYQSRIQYLTPLGHGWDSDLFEKLVVDATTGDAQRVLVGRVDTWRHLGGGHYQAPPSFYGDLRRQMDGTFVLREPDGSKTHFDTDGRLARREDPSGNRMLFEYEGGQLVRVLDPYKHVVTLTYTGERLTRVRDHTGREVVYGYENDCLVSARTPVVVGTSTGDDQPAGRTERYVYTSDRTDPRLARNLAAIVRPEEVASSGVAYYSWTYYEDPTDERLFDRVATQTLGGTNASGVSAGGTWTFAYEPLNAGAPSGDPQLPRSRTTVVDRGGNVREYEFNERAERILSRQRTRGLRASEPAAYETRSWFNDDGQLVRRVFPAGNELRLAYATGPRAAQANVVEMRMVAGPRGGGADLVTRLEYEPLFQRLVAITDPRGTTGYTPPLGAWSAERYTTRFVLDYQEGSGPVAEAEAWGIDLSGVARGLGDRNGDGRTDQVAGNVVRSTAPSVTLRPESLEAARLGSTTQVVLTETTWNDRGQPTSVCDAEGNVTELTYFPQNDPDGDGALDSQLSNEASGYLAVVRKDARTSPRRRTTTPPLLLESRLSYDRVGHLTGAQDPRGVVTRLEVNALGEVVQLTRGDDVSVAVMTGQLVTGEAPFRYRARYFHDLNGRVTRTQVENRDDATPGVGLWVDREVVYDILDQPVEVRDEIDGTTSAVTKLRYDANENMILVEGPDGQRTAFQHDERDLLFRATRGEGTLAASTIEVDYDLNGNRRRVQDAEDTDGNGEREATFWSYDGFDRVVEVVDALQNQVQIEHDVASQVVRQVVLGHPAGDPLGASVVLTDARFEHDELGRVFRSHAALFLAGQLPAQRSVTLSDHDGDGLVTTLVEHDALSRTWAVVEDDLQTSRSLFDGASRVVESIDAPGNRQVMTHDRNGNPLAVTSVEVAAVPGVASESFTTRYVWDQLGRLARVSDNAGQTAYFTYDSRDQLAQRADAVGAAITDPLGLVPGAINAPGNTTRWTHDGLGRILTEARDLRVGGIGGAPLDLSNPANPDGQVRLAYVWDRSSRLRAIVDDAGRTTTMAYDLLDRKTTHTYADGSFAQFTFDKDDNVKSILDPNGSVITRTHDALNRLVQVDVSRAPGVSGTTRETYAHDGLGRVVRMTDDNGGLVPSVVERTFDSLSRLVEERQDGKAISSSYTGDGKRTQVTYPGGRTIGYLHDALDRVQRITEGVGPGASLIAEYGWIGPGHRPLFRRSGNGTALTMLDDLGQADVGYDAVQRVVRLRHVGPSGQAFVDRAHGYDRASNRIFEQRLDDGGLTDRYAYDSTYRVTSSFFDEAGPAGGDPTPSATRRELVASAYRYDGVGNRVEVTEDRLVTRPPTPGGGKAAIHARERVDLGEQSQVEGDVLVDETRDHGWCRLGHGRHCRGHGHGGHDRGRGHRRGQESSATLDDRAVVKGDVVAERVELKRQARVEGDVETDALRRGQGSAVTGAVSAYASPDPAVQDVERVNSGRTDFTSRLNQTVTLQPGRYDDVRILAGSRLILPGGTYEMGSLHLGLGVVVEVRGAVRLRVACGLQLLHGVKVQPAAGLTMAQVRWETTDNNVLLGNDVQFFGELAAPEARVDVGRDARIRGAIEAQRVVVGACAQVYGPPSGPGSPGGVDRVQRQVAYGVNALNQYTTVGGVARGHDRSGNLVDDGVRWLTWDYRNRLVAVADKASGRPIAAYAYDYGNRRVRKTTYTAAGGVDRVTRSFWDGWDLVEEQNTTGATEATFVSGVGIDEHIQVARTSASPLGPAVLWCAQDARGDVVAVTNASGTVVERAKFDDFGRQTGGGGAQPHGFQGRYRDTETGWAYFRNRYFDPETGRFLSRDPAWDPVNRGSLYTFCGNGPISRCDPSGLLGSAIDNFRARWGDAKKRCSLWGRYKAIVGFGYDAIPEYANPAKQVAHGWRTSSTWFEGGKAVSNGLFSDLNAAGYSAAAEETYLDVLPGYRSGERAVQLWTLGKGPGDKIVAVVHGVEGVGDVGLTALTLGPVVAGKLTPKGSTYQERLNLTPTGEGGKGWWSGARGESTYYPTQSKFNSGPLNSANAGRGVSYADARVDFSPFAVHETKIQGMTADRARNFRLADEATATELGVSPAEIKAWREANGFTWHEVPDMATVQLVPTSVNTPSLGGVGHMGGVGEINRGGRP